jgi:CO/xanthine dehydrogenase Mo-binding subunit
MQRSELVTKKEELTSYPRIDGVERVTGLAKYAGDWKLSDMLYGRVVLSTIPSGRVKKFDLSRAQNIPGVEAILTCFDDATIWDAGEREQDRRVFTDRVRFVGDCIGAVAAKTRNVAQEAVDAIGVDYEEERGSFSIKDSLKEGAPKLWDSGNVIGPLEYGYGDIDAAFEQADFTFEGDYATQRVHNAPLEPGTSIAYWDKDGKLTVIAATQSLYGTREGLSLDLKIPEEKIRVIAHYKGGGFGNKASSMNYDIVAALLSKKTGKPVLVEYSRGDDFVGVHGRWGSEQHLKAAIRKSEGKMLGVDLKAYCDIGGYTRAVKAGNFVQGAEGYYSTIAWKGRVYPVYTNTPATAHMRAPMGPVANFAAETFVDELAHELRIDPVEFRIRNAVVKYDNEKSFTSGSMKDCLIAGAEAFSWKKRWQRPPSPKASGTLARGIGVSLGSWHANVGDGEAIVKASPDGTFLLTVGVVDIGTGAKSTMAGLAAKALGVPLSKVEIAWGDSDNNTYAIGESGGRLTSFTAPAVREACAKVKNRILAASSQVYAVPKDQLEIRGEEIFKKNESRPLGRIQDVVKRSGAIEEKASVEQTTPKDSVRYSFAAHFSEVLIDLETGMVSLENYLAVHDSGEIVNELTGASQVRGSVIMGLGMALSEQVLIDPNYGGMLNPSFMNYRLPNHAQIPKIDVMFLKTVDPYGPKSLGEIGIVPVQACLGNAIFNATGVRLRRIPFTAESFLRAYDPSYTWD